MNEISSLATGMREPLLAFSSDEANPIGLDGIEFIEYATSKPQALGQVLEMMGFKPVSRHRSREVLLYRQGGLNVVVNAHTTQGRDGRLPDTSGVASLSAIALRVRDARAAYRYVQDKGAWPVPTHAEVMELSIPAIHGVGGSRIYFVDRYREFSIYGVDFIPVPGVEQDPPATAGIHFFGVVQYIGPERSNDWIEFYTELLGARLIPDEERFGILPKGKLMRLPAIHPGAEFLFQLIEPEPNVIDVDERLQRIGLGVPDVLQAVQQLRRNGVEFVETEAAHSEARGAISKTYLGAVVFELVKSTPGVQP